MTVTLLVSTRDAGRGGEGRGRTSFSELGDGDSSGGGYFLAAWWGRGLRQRGLAQEEGKGASLMGELASPHARGRRGDSVCWGRWAPLGEGSCGEDGFHKCEGEL